MHDVGEDDDMLYGGSSLPPELYMFVKFPYKRLGKGVCSIELVLLFINASTPPYVYRIYFNSFFFIFHLY